MVVVVAVLPAKRFINMILKKYDKCTSGLCALGPISITACRTKKVTIDIFVWRAGPHV